MPFSGPSSYLTTIDEFISHWSDVNTELAPGNLTLAGPYSLASLTAARANLSTSITDLVAAINVVEGHRTARDNQKPVIRERMRQLGNSIRGLLPHGDQVGKIPELVPMDANPGKWLIAMRDNVNLWVDVNANPPSGFTPPLLLTGAYPVATFTTDCNALETTLSDLTEADKHVDTVLKTRDSQYLAIRDQLVLYRLAVEGMFPAGHPLILSLPRVYPLPGHTPDPVVLTAVWNDVEKVADLSWTASTDPDLAYYVVRRSIADPYDTTNEIFVEQIVPPTLTFATNAGLENPGTTMSFKVYVVLNTGNERGSNAVLVEYP